MGALAGAGAFSLAAIGTVAVVLANTVLRPLGRRIDRHPTGGDEVRTDYRFEAVCADTAEAHVRALLVQALTRPEFQLRAIRSYNTNDHVTVTADLAADHRDDRLFEYAVSRLSLEADVTAISWAAHNDHDSDDDSEDPVAVTTPAQQRRRH